MGHPRYRNLDKGFLCVRDLEGTLGGGVRLSSGSDEKHKGVKKKKKTTVHTTVGHPFLGPVPENRLPLFLELD